jgi:cysteine desulfurase
LEVYLDNSATTKPLKAAVDKALTMMKTEYGNPSSLHRKGFEASGILEEARGVIAKSLFTEPKCIYFSPSGTAANNTAIFGAAQSLRRKGNKIVTTAIEHPSVQMCMNCLETQGFDVVRLAPDKSGNIDIEQFRNAIDKNTIFVSIMAVNNEVGSVLPFEKIKKIIKATNSPALLHVDAIQAYMKLELKPERCGIDLMSLSAHKIHALKGAGALFVANGVRIKPYILGGGQENGMFSGTQAMPNIAAFAEAVKELGSIEARYETVSNLNGYLISELEKLPFVKINSPENALPYIVNISVNGIPSQVSVNALSQKGVYLSAGSACSKGHRSDVLTAMGLQPWEIDSALRISLSFENTKDDIDYFINALKETYTEIQGIN